MEQLSSSAVNPGPLQARPAPVHLSKVSAAWLASIFGLFGAHWWYLRRRGAWMVTLFAVLMIALTQFYPVWWDSPPFLILVVPITAGFIESLIFALKPDAWFDAKYNQESGSHTRTGWNAVYAAIFSTLVGAMVLMFAIALIVLHVYTAMGWLEGYVL